MKKDKTNQKEIKDGERYFEIEYSDLPISVWEKSSDAVLYPSDLAHPAEYDENQLSVDYTFDVRASDIADWLYDNAGEIDSLKDIPEDQLEGYIAEHLEELFNENLDMISDYYREEAISEAEENYEPEEYEYDPGDMGPDID